MFQYLTPDGLEKLKKELVYLENDGRKEAAEKMRHAISFGDISENAAYDEARESQILLECKISELKGKIADAKLIVPSTSSGQGKSCTGKVQVGSFVLVLSDRKKQEFQIVGSEEADVLAGKISNQSPLGKMLLEKEKGSKICLDTPDGKIEYKILEIK
ncbi:MAG: transcription elongation factor GreA [Patescibacteria group bacterium]